MAMNIDPTFPCLATAPSEAPLNKKRRFVPSSTLSFNPLNLVGQDSVDSPLLLQAAGRTPTSQEIESELLQVGMRIRKSVNDGYQTGQKMFTPRPFFNMHRLSPETQAALTGSLDSQPISTATFCGINLAALARISSTPVEEPRMWSYSTSHKRGYEGDSDSDDQEFMPHTPTLGDHQEMMAIPVDYFSIDFESMGEVSPMTQPQEARFMQGNGRRMAKPKSRRQQPAVQRESAFNPFAQMQLPESTTSTSWMGHRRMTSCGMEANMTLNDFGEAPFLQRREDLEMDCS